uniref:Uncharacterized protein n=1 Tax=Aegilops tauschii subsp. strangulata TaxID=200361 RepID=A0A453P4I0_AEGTS
MISIPVHQYSLRSRSKGMLRNTPVHIFQEWHLLKPSAWLPWRTSPPPRYRFPPKRLASLRCADGGHERSEGKGTERAKKGRAGSNGARTAWSQQTGERRR